MQYKRIVLACLVVILTLCATIFTVGAETPLEVAVGVDSSTPAVVKSGEEFTVNVTMKSNPGVAIFKLEMAYDAINLEFVEAKNGNVFSNSADITKITNNNGVVKYEYIGSNDVTKADATLMTVTFKAKATINPEASVMILTNQTSAANASMNVLYGSKFGATAKAISFQGNPAALHTHTLATLNVPATCEEDACTKYICSACDYVYTVTAPNTALNHTAGAWVTVEAATPDSIGYKTQSCTVCQEILSIEKIPALGHTYESVVTPATCTDKGYTTHTCKSCATAHSYVDTFTDKIAHTEADIPAVNATCTSAGSANGKYCTACEAVLKAPEIVQPLAHTAEAIPAVDATCTTAGSANGEKCSVCDAILKAPEVVQPLGHKTEKIPAVEPTAGAVGSSEGEQCTVCDEVTVKPVELAKKSLAWLWVLIVCVVVMGGAAGAYFFLNKKNGR